MKSGRSRIRYAKKRGNRVAGWLEILTNVMELVVAVIVMVGFTMGIVPLIRELPSLLSFDGSGEGTFHVFLEHAFNLVIGIEFIRMLIRHTPGSALEVLMFALARHLVLSGGSGAELLFSVAAIGGVFAIRKYLMISGFEAEDGEEEDEKVKDEADAGRAEDEAAKAGRGRAEDETAKAGRGRAEDETAKAGRGRAEDETAKTGGKRTEESTDGPAEDWQ